MVQIAGLVKSHFFRCFSGVDLVKNALLRCLRF